jgi:hypothetical protein
MNQARSPACPEHSRVAFRAPYFSLKKFFISLSEAAASVIANHSAGTNSDNTITAMGMGVAPSRIDTDVTSAEVVCLVTSKT